MKRVAVTIFMDANVLPYWKDLARVFSFENPEELMARTLEQLVEAGNWFRLQIVGVCTMPVQPKPNDPAIICGRRRPCPIHDSHGWLPRSQPTLAMHDAKKGDDE